MEVRKITKSERVIEERDHEDGSTGHTILFSAGTLALLMACVKCAMPNLLVEQWRAWVFLVLNLVLLAILFTSTRSEEASNETQQCKNNVAMKDERNKKNKSHCCTGSAPEVEECTIECKEIVHSEKIISGGNNEPEEKVEDDAEIPRLSKEELNERVETFIAMFRQHLVSDAKKGRAQFFEKSERAKTLNFRRVAKSNVNLTSPLQGVKCLNVEVKG
ncbi:hypothetical protein SO802_001252 [Lithocarpus litseifolius]|uniref:Transmembrane protein n=1 Tax=Lithocarpus litseifolius TaxID=425828 RepID=A0AAW2DX95_9ROSI